MEIVAPAGNFNKLKTAILYGADAVYLAGQKYSLRAGADNFTTAELKQASQSLPQTPEKNLCYSKRLSLR